MAIVAPSILSADFGRLHEEIRDVVDRGAPWVHVDVMDGQFVPNLTIGPPVVEAAARAARAGAAKAVVDCHLMIVDPDRYIAAFREAGADVITVHAEACVHLHRSIQVVRASGAKVGVALNPHTPPSVLEYVLDELDLVLAMTVNPGFGGQSLIEPVLRKVSVLREWITARGLATHVQVDGGVKPSNAGLFTSAGADVLVAGSGVFGAKDRSAAIAAIAAA